MGSGLRKQDSEVEARRELRLLEALHGDRQLTQRRLSTKLGIALGLTNLYLKRLISKGYVKCLNVRPNRIHYLVTPEGLLEKARLTYEFMQYSLQLYRKTRRHLRDTLEEALRGERRAVAIYGTGESAELAYISLKEFGLEPVAIFDGEVGGRFLGMTVRPLVEHPSVGYDMMIIATLEPPGCSQRGSADERPALSAHRVSAKWCEPETTCPIPSRKGRRHGPLG